MGVLKLKMYQVDAFASAVFGGNPAAVCILEEWIADETMQRIAEENNLAETAYAVYNNGVYDIRWFTPEEEVDLCGHATLATSYVLFNHETKYLSEATKNNALQLHSHRSGPLSVVKQGDDIYELNFPVDDLNRSDFNLSHTEVLVGCKAIKAFEGKTDLMLIYENEAQIRSLQPNFFEIDKIKVRGIICTAPGDRVDFVSRFFAPQCGVPEDPATGSAHTTLTPYWVEQFGKTQLSAQQLSKRVGNFECTLFEDRVLIRGKAFCYLIGKIYVPQ